MVYSSSHQIGVGVVAGTPETPGMILNVGYRGLNVAYVPVAVAKHCPKGSERACDRITYGLIRLAGTSDQGIFTSSDRNTIDILRRTIESAEGASEILRQAIERDERLKERIEGAAARLTILRAEQNPLQAAATRSPEQESRFNQLASEIAELEGLETLVVVRARLTSNTQERTRIETGLQTDRQHLATLVQARNSRNADLTRDSFSVFGSFNGSAKGNSTSAGIVAGQIFSTGVAAQNLTRGMRQSAIATACFASITELAPQVTAAERDKFIQDGIALCRGTLALADNAH